MIIICPNELKKKLLKEQKTRLEMIRYYTLEMVIERLFPVSIQTNIKIAELLGIRYANAVIYGQHLRYLEQKHYGLERLNELVELQKKLTECKFYQQDELFLHALAQHEVVVRGYFLTQFDWKIVHILRQYTYVTVEEPQTQIKELSCYEYETTEAEYDAMFVSIRELLDRGVHVNQIYIMNVSEQDSFLLHQYARLYHIPVLFSTKNSVLGLPVVARLLEKIELEPQEIVAALEAEGLEKDEKAIVVDLLNQFRDVKTLRKEVIEYELEHNMIPGPLLTDVVRVLPLEDAGLTKDDYVFIPGLQLGVLPKEHKNDRFYSDRESLFLGIDTTHQFNQREIKVIQHLLSILPNVTISYAKRNSTEALHPSRLVRELNMQIKYPEKVKKHYSKERDRLWVSEQLDEYFMFQQDHKEIGIILNSLDSYYRQYDHTFFLKEKSILEPKLHAKHTLSYSSITDYFKCPFSYYIKHILKLDEHSDTFYTILGTIFHEVLEKYETFEEVKVLEDSYATQFETAQEQFFFRKLFQELEGIFQFLQELKRETTLTEELHEARFEIPLQDAYGSVFKGFVDRILYREEAGKTYLAIMDYKTGTVNTTFDNINYGLNIQLLSYAYLIQKSCRFHQPVMIGLYFEQLISELKRYQKNKTLQEQKEEDLMLQGYTIDDLSLISLLYQKFPERNIIKHLKLKNDGTFYQYAKVIKEEDLMKLLDLLDQMIHDALQKITNGEFPIRPLEIGRKQYGCEFCHYQHLCYKTYDDRRVEPERKLVDILKGGEEHELYSRTESSDSFTGE